MRLNKYWSLAVGLLFSAAASSAFASNARLQVIHNAADPAAAIVDVYVNGSLLLDEFAFRTATPFVDVPAGVELNIGVAPGGNSTPADIIATFPVTLAANKKYIVFANGVVGSGFAPNPNGIHIAFTLFPYQGARETSYSRKLVDVMAFHGATDAPAVDLLVRGANIGLCARFTDLSYGEFASYKSILPYRYVIDVTPAGDPATVVASFQADLSGLKKGAAVVFASGFLDPAANQNGPAFGLFAALPNGTVIALPSATTARLQVVHNAADPAASVVDVYVNDSLLLDDFAFRTATPFVDVPGNVNLKIGVAPGNSTSSGDAIASFDVVLAPNKAYTVFANGVLDASGFASNPNGRSIGFTLFPREGVSESTPFDWFVKILAFHGATDAPAVDVRVAGGWFGSWALFTGLTYGDFSASKLLLPRRYVLNVTPAGDRKTVVASFVADLSGLRGGSAVVFASGFLTPGANQNGPAFGLYAVLPDGSVLALPAETASSSNVLAAAEETAPTFVTELGQNYPNPFNPQTTIAFTLAGEAAVKLDVFNARGQLVERLIDRDMPAGSHTVPFDAGRLASGVYFYKFSTGSFVQTRRMVLLK